MQTEPCNLRLHIGLFGRRNVGKSSLLNAITRQEAAIVSETPGTTTDPVEKPMELLPLGSVLFIDTAGLDDSGALGEKRIAKTRQALDRTDLGVLVTEAGMWGDFEEALLAELRSRSVPVIVVFNKGDLGAPGRPLLARLAAETVAWVQTAALSGAGIGDLRRALVAAAPADYLDARRGAGDLVGPGELVVLVVPIDKGAPKGRLILPQVQTIRDALDNDASILIVKERELASTLTYLNRKPDLAVCDSQAILKVSADVSKDIPCTTFSILFARQKGNLSAAAAGAAAIETLLPGDRVLIAEACSHHPLQDDIGRIKIPRWLSQYVGGELKIDIVAGRDYPEGLDRYRLIIHCGSCMLTRREMLARLQKAKEASVPVTNYGLAISFTQGVIRRVLSPFPSALIAFDRRIAEIRKERHQGH